MPSGSGDLTLPARSVPVATLKSWTPQPFPNALADAGIALGGEAAP
jgi:hypothetical protein